MLVETALLIGVLFTCGTFLILRRSFVQILFGFIILSNAANLLVLALSGSPARRVPPILQGGPGTPVDPLPQALILTAIVIGFGMTAYLVLLLYRIFLDHKTTSMTDLYREGPEGPGS